MRNSSTHSLSPHYLATKGVPDERTNVKEYQEVKNLHPPLKLLWKWLTHVSRITWRLSEVDQELIGVWDEEGLIDDQRE